MGDPVEGRAFWRYINFAVAGLVPDAWFSMEYLWKKKSATKK